MEISLTVRCSQMAYKYLDSAIIVDESLVISDCFTVTTVNAADEFLNI